MSSSRASLPNFYLRKRRKWPIPPYKTKWHPDFASQEAMEMLKEKAKHSKTNLLQSLIDSFATHNCSPFPDAYHFIIKRLFRNHPRTWDQIPQVVRHMQKVAVFETPEAILVDLIMFYGKSNGTVQKAIDYFFQIPKFRCNPTVYSLNALLEVLCEKRCCLHIVPQILIKSQLLNIRVEDSSFMILIRAMCRFGKVNVAVQLFNYMVVRKTLDFDGRIATLILRAMIEQKESDIMLFLRDTRNLGGFRIEKADWCNVICCLVKMASGKDAMEALTWMRQDGVEADIVCYNLVLDKLVLDEDYVCADKLFDEMLVLGLVPDIFTYNSYIMCLCKQNEVEDAVKMLDCMEELGCKPNLKTYDIILKALLTVGKWGLAKEITRKMECFTERSHRNSSVVRERVVMTT